MLARAMRYLIAATHHTRYQKDHVLFPMVVHNKTVLTNFSTSYMSSSRVKATQEFDFCHLSELSDSSVKIISRSHIHIHTGVLCFFML